MPRTDDCKKNVIPDFANNDRLLEIFWTKRFISIHKVGFKGSMFKGSEIDFLI